jgi:hypothetical protein
MVSPAIRIALYVDAALLGLGVEPLHLTPRHYRRPEHPINRIDSLLPCRVADVVGNSAKLAA